MAGTMAAMGLFRRRGRSSGDDDSGAGVQGAARAAALREAITAFWAWWQAEGARGVADAIEQDGLDDWADVITARVHGIDEGLAWELGPGDLSAHVLVVTAAGAPELRAVARRWWLAAPEADATWSYSDARLPLPDLDGWGLRVAGHEISAPDVLVGARVDRRRACVDVTVHHPAFEAMDQETRTQVTYLLLDNALGEADVESWVGEVESATVPPLDAVTLSGLRAVVRELRAEHTDADGQPSWVLLEGRTADGARMLAATQVPLRPATAPHLDTHVTVTLGFGGRTEEGLPDETSLSALRRLEDRLGERLGADGRVVGYETSQGVRRVHVYVDGAGPGAGQVREVVEGWDLGGHQVDVAYDPAWRGVAHLRG